MQIRRRSSEDPSLVFNALTDRARELNRQADGKLGEAARMSERVTAALNQLIQKGDSSHG